jgi:environmental stress-induced protein Ves
MARLIRFDSLVPVPWKNGAGTTREIWKLTGADGAPAIRLSVAEIQGDQAFSSFPGIDRVILQLDGPPMQLSIDGQAHALQRGQPLPFAGEAAVTCSLAGSGLAHDLNLMCNRQAFSGRMTVCHVQAGAQLPLPATATLAAVLALAPCTLFASASVDLGLYDTVMADHAEPLRAVSPAHVVLLTAEASAARLAEGRLNA